MINEQLVREHLEWTSKTFPKGTGHGAALHAQREIKEVLDDMENPDLQGTELISRLTEEYADVLGCLIDSMNRSGISPEQVNEAFARKLEKNKARKWKDNGDGSYSHIKEQEIIPEIIQKRALKYPLLKSEDNISIGLIEKHKYAGGFDGDIGKQVVDPVRTEGDKEYSCQWVHLGDSWFKMIGKWESSGTSCQ